MLHDSTLFSILKSGLVLISGLVEAAGDASQKRAARRGKSIHVLNIVAVFKNKIASNVRSPVFSQTYIFSSVSILLIA